MFHTLKHSRSAWLAIGLIAGLFVGGFWPQSPLHAVATDRNDTFAMATGLLDDEVEAVFFLDFLTGDLRATVLNRLGQFNIFYEYNVMQDLQIAPGKNPRFLMTTGVADLQRRGGSMQFGRSVVYVAEVTTGNVAAYAVPWSTALRTSNRPMRTPLQPLNVTKFRAAAGGGAGPAAPVGTVPRGR